jgi:hypothetical protein
MKQIIYYGAIPNLHSKGRKFGRGMGSVLLGGVGSASSYQGVDDYETTTGRTIGNGLSLFSAGAGIGLGLNDSRSRSKLNQKLESLNITPKKEKSKNIRFNL